MTIPDKPHGSWRKYRKHAFMKNPAFQRLVGSDCVAGLAGRVLGVV